jgi:hypothetical protein
MIAADAVRVACCLAAALIIWRDGPPTAVCAAAVLTSVAGTLFRPAQAALLPALARHAGELTASNVASSTIDSVGFFVGPRSAQC